MDTNIITNVEGCYVDIPNLLYYSHIPTVITCLLISFFVFWKNRGELISKILLSIGILFLLWSVTDIILWKTYDSRVSMFFWSLVNLIEMLVSATTLYFAYVFIEKKDAPFKFKIVISSLLLVYLFLIPTSYNLTGFNSVSCEGIQGPLTYYYYSLEALFSLWLVLYLIFRIRKFWKTEEKNKIIYFSIGIMAFLISFSGANIIGSALTAFNITLLGSSNDNWQVLQYGLFGMPIFMAFLAYIIVRFRVFNIKMIATQALVAAMIILIASQFTFIQNPTNKILTGITLILTIIGGYILVKSVEMEVKRKEQLQEMTDKLASANDQLRKLDNAKSEFISIASHQLRTPLTAVKGYGSLLLEGSYGKMSEKQKDVLNKMYQSNERLIALVEDLLNLSRIESGRMEYKFEPVKIEGVMQEIFDTFILKAKERKLSFEMLKNEKPLPEVKTDRNKIREIISNFTDNAIKYTPEGGVKLRAYEQDGKVVVAVSDTGIGIPKDEIPYLFEKFSRGKDVSRLNAGGTGLGLHVGIKMIEELKGRIWVESEGTGRGSTFFVELPR